MKKIKCLKRWKQWYDIMKLRKYFIILLILSSVLFFISSVSAEDVYLETHDFGDFKMGVPEGSNFVKDENDSVFHQDTTSYGEVLYEKESIFRNEGDDSQISNIFYYTFSESLKDQYMNPLKYEASDMLKYNRIENKSNLVVYEIPKKENKPDKYLVVYYVDGNEDNFNKCFYVYGNNLHLMKEAISTINF